MFLLEGVNLFLKINNQPNRREVVEMETGILREGANQRTRDRRRRRKESKARKATEVAKIQAETKQLGKETM